MTQLRPHEAELAELNIQVLVVTFQPPQLAQLYVEETQLPWPLLVDESRSVYAAIGMERGSVWNVWGPQNWGVYFKLMAKGRALRAPAGDVHQLGGDILIDPGGIVRLHHVGVGPADRPTVESLLEHVRDAPAG